MMKKGYVHVYTGDGKGKTTAAIGLAVRASGRGLRTYIGMFLKGTPYGEVEALHGDPLIAIDLFGGEGHVRRGKASPREKDRAQKGCERALESMLSGQYDLVILDEILVAVDYGLLGREHLTLLLDRRPEGVELVLTGRGAPPEIIDRADLVTEMREIKHYYSRGIQARDGIER